MLGQFQRVWAALKMKGWRKWQNCKLESMIWQLSILNLLLNGIQTKNGDVTPQNVSKGSDFHAWWRCSVCGYEWQVRVKNRVHGSGCNQCKVNAKAIKQRKKVYQFTLSGEYVKEYDCAASAASALGISVSAIKNACNPKVKLQTAGGYKWSYIEK